MRSFSCEALAHFERELPLANPLTADHHNSPTGITYLHTGDQVATASGTIFCPQSASDEGYTSLFLQQLSSVSASDI